ncbi:MAG: phosphate ABC transporter substrate-binding/OmpA family protein [Saprospiraceae bacterium]
MARLTTFSKLLLTLLIVGAVAFGIYTFQNSDAGKKLIDDSKELVEDAGSNNGTSTSNSGTNSSNGDPNTIKIGVVTWGGYAGGQYYNEGFKANTQSRFYKDYGFKVEFKILDDFEQSRNAFKSGGVDLLWATIDAFPTEVEALRKYEPQVVFQADWSRGGDAIVSRRGINKVSDLRGKRVAVAELTPSHSFLLWLLDAGGLTINDITLVSQASAIDAAAAFKSGQVDAAVVWSPDDEDCVKSVAGSRILESSKSASHIIADVFIAKKAYVEANEQKLRQLYEGWMKGAAEINANAGNKKKAAKILADAFDGFDESMTLNAINNVRLCTHGDNQNFFGLNSSYKNMTGEALYNKMTNVYRGIGAIKANAQIPNWRLIRYSGLVSGTQLTGASHTGEGQKTFAAIKESDKSKASFASKQVSITFRTGEFQLDENAKYIIDKDFVEIAKAFGNARIRIEGNTDNVGSRSSNVSLSKKRAQSVASYLINEHGMPRNRIIVIGNGPDKPVASNDTADGKAKNRRTDFELIPD